MASAPLFQAIRPYNILHRLTNLTIFFLLLALLIYRLQFFKDHGISITWFLAFLCECWFTFTWFLITNNKWSPVKYVAHPEQLLNRADELLPVDMFVTTADPVLEPPIITVNTVLSLLAVDYPANKLACYVSDDGASPVTFYSLVETVEFAKLWIPFCKKHNVQVRAPFRYFSTDNQPQQSSDNSLEYLQEWSQMKDKYKLLVKKIEEAEHTSASYKSEIFSNVERRNHPTILKVLWENKEGLADGVPHVVYISREKRPKHPHNYKAGALNVLARVSGVMTNSPIMLNVDCDMFVNNPKIVVDSMCFLLGTKDHKESAFVQFPQLFYGCHKDDPFGNQMIVDYEYTTVGIAGIQGIYYGGTGCFHRRKVMYGLSLNEAIKPTTFSLSIGESLEELKKTFGQSPKLVESASKCLSGSNDGFCCPHDISSSLKEAIQVADLTYESHTEWGAKIGWRYGSTTEDMQTGLRIHSQGWKSIYYKPDIPGFLGCTPSSGPTSMVQAKRWSTGLLEILFTSNSPIFGVIFGKLLFRQCLAYFYVTLWAARSLPELCYTVLPAYCLLYNTSFLPSVSEPAILIPTSLFLIYNILTLVEHLSCGLSFRAWWNKQRMSRIVSTTAWFFGFLSVILKLLRLSETVFEVTPKDSTNNTTVDDDDDSNKAGKHTANSGSFTFDDSPVFMLGTTIALVHLGALVLCFTRLLMLDQNNVGLLEMFCSVWVVLSFLPFVKGLFRRGKYGIPSSTLYKSVGLAGVFLQLCRWASVD